MSDRAKQKNRGGAPKGNQNARKHGMYSKVLSLEQQDAMQRVMKTRGLDQEIALMRVKIKGLLKTDPNNRELLSKAMGTLGRLLRTRQRVGG